MNTREFRERLTRRARRAGLTVSPELSVGLEAYYRLLAMWNAKINLTGLNLQDAADEAFDRLLIEPLAAARYVPGTATKLLDVGSGGGSPAIPMKLAAPRLSLTMVESKTRKAVFLREAIRTMGLERAEAVTTRLEELLTRPDLHEAYDLVTLRAVRVESRLLMSLQALVRPGGLLFLFRGSAGRDRPDPVSPLLAWRASFPLVEALGSHLVILERRQLGTPDGLRDQMFHVKHS